MISDDRMEKALKFIAENDVRLAELKTEVERATYRCKRIRAFQYELVEGKSVEDRKAAVERSEIVANNEDYRINAFLDYEKLKAKMETEQLVLEIWRSLNANRRMETIR